MLQYIAVCCSGLQCVLQCAAVDVFHMHMVTAENDFMLQDVAVCCSALQCVAVNVFHAIGCCVLQCVAVCCSVLQ